MQLYRTPSVYAVILQKFGWTPALALLLAIAILTPPALHAQTFQVIHDFTGGRDGSTPLGRLSVDAGGRLYGGTYSGGSGQYGGQGLIFKLSPEASGWTFAPLYTFTPESDGAAPYSGVQFGLYGLLYGTTSNGGTMFTLGPQVSFPRSVFTPWHINYHYEFPENAGFPY